MSTHVDETSQLCTWHVPRAHVLESWSDTQSEDGTAAVTQPLIAPMYGGKTDAEVLEHLVGGTRSGYDLVRNNWGGLLGAGMEKTWRRVLHDGVLVAKPPESPDTAKAGDPLDDGDDAPPKRTVNADAIARADVKPPTGPFEVIFAPDPHAYDGRFANNGWLMELPDPIHKATWMSVASISHATAQKLGVKDGDHIDVTVLGKTVTLPAGIAFGHADDSVTLPVGLGRRFEGRVCKGVGVDCNAVRSTKGFYIAGGDVKKGSGFEQLATTQGHFVMEGRPLVRG